MQGGAMIVYFGWAILTMFPAVSGLITLGIWIWDKESNVVRRSLIAFIKISNLCTATRFIFLDCNAILCYPCNVSGIDYSPEDL